jgi:adenylate cyclase
MSRTKTPDLIGRPSGVRKLIAVLHADMAGYSRLIGLDDVGTLERLRTLRSILIDPAIDENGGRIVNTGGDSLLIVFDSVDGAMRCAMRVQQEVPANDGDFPPDQAIRFRVGINVGDVIPDGTDVHGEVVNVAARLQAECPPGGICVSRPVRDHVQDRLDLVFEELGPLKLKNISRPVEAFVLRPGVAATAPTLVERPLADNILEPLLLPGKPSIAVLAFTNMSGDLDQEYFSDGIADDIITELSRSRSLFVIARNSSFTYKGRAVDVKQVARELGVRYVVAGSVRRSGSRVRVTAQLIDADTGNQVWAERYDRDISEVFAVQDEITTAVVTAIVPAVADAELRRALRKPPENLGAWEAYQRGLWHMGRGNPIDNSRAQQFFNQAINADPSFASAYSASAMAIGRGAGYGEGPLVEVFRAAGERAREAVEIDPNDADAQAVLALVRVGLDGFDQGPAVVSALSAFLRHHPNAAWAHGAKGMILVQLGRCIEGREALLTAERLNPRDPTAALFPSHFATSYYYERNYALAATSAKAVVERYPNDPRAYRWLAAALGQLGRADEARDALNKAIQVSPDAFTRYVLNRPPHYLPQNHDHLLEGLRMAGWRADVDGV